MGKILVMAMGFVHHLGQCMRLELGIKVLIIFVKTCFCSSGMLLRKVSWIVLKSCLMSNQVSLDMVSSKVIVEKSRGVRFLWNRN